MKAAVYYENGGPEVFRYEDVPDPECHRKGIVIRVEAVSIEGGDTLNRAGGALAARPHVVGYQAAGEIIEVGRDDLHACMREAPCHGCADTAGSASHKGAAPLEVEQRGDRPEVLGQGGNGSLHSALVHATIVAKAPSVSQAVWM